MKGGVEFIKTDENPETKNLSLYGDDATQLQYRQVNVQTYLKLKDDTHLKFTLYNIEAFNKYEKQEFNLTPLGIEHNDINDLFICGFLTKWTRKELFIKKGKVNKNEISFKEIGKTLYELCDKNKKDSDKIQIILAHSTEKKALCIIFNMSGIDGIYYNSLKKSLSGASFSDKTILEGKIKISQLENLIDFTNKKLIIGPVYSGELKTRFLQGLLFPNEIVGAPKEKVDNKSKTRFLQGLLFPNEIVGAPKEKVDNKSKTRFLQGLLFPDKSLPPSTYAG
jgi:hypothetical protein